MFKARHRMGEHILDTVEAGLEKGRETMAEVIPLERGLKRLGRKSDGPSTGALWLGAGALAGAIALVLGRSRRWSPLAADGHVRDVMVTDVQTIGANATLREAAERMQQDNIGVLPVLDGDQIKGVITDRDLVVRGMARGADPASTRVADCATKGPIAARPDWSVEEALAVMAREQIGRLPVVDEGGRVVGIVTLSSLALRSRSEDRALDAAKEVSRRSARAS